MESALAVHLGSLDNFDSIAEADLTDGLDSSVEEDLDSQFDLNPDDHGNNSEGSENDGDNLDEHEINTDYIADYNDEALEDFTYEAEGEIYVEGHAIHLLRLIGGTGPIQAHLFKAFLHKTGDGIPYEALSYTWGSTQRTEHIVVNGECFMVTANLYSVLQHLRRKNEDRILWIDAICIDQSHIPERNHQVSHMASIYRDADSVIFWLGEGTYDTKHLIDALQRFHDRTGAANNVSRRNASELWGDVVFHEDFLGFRQGLESLLEQPWFKRSWILQEVCFAKTGVVMCGMKGIAAHTFALTPLLVGKIPEAHYKAVLDMMPKATRSTRDFLSGREM